jgi:hypothetical protein
MTKQTDVVKSVCKEKRQLRQASIPKIQYVPSNISLQSNHGIGPSKLKEDNVGIDCEECLSILADSNTITIRLKNMLPTTTGSGSTTTSIHQKQDGVRGQHIDSTNDSSTNQGSQSRLQRS